ncbi:hypothetical protein [Blastococcus tunisiensis]|uniref:Uncharacterized protein n=1 Tax=Blastococcus tunisiensis TaxID=1798228 RepID=A0A1I2BMI9_9ACTN|nr:hypothetical protein [Blastococcus sp. DSM 46838]SFE56450.1 hypothetical protein SAMN05216574_104185 [Blastococcus sp. DSM 46838]
MSPDRGPRDTSPTTVDRGPTAATPWVLRIAGAALLAAMGWIHLGLWNDGYRSIDVIGPAFLLNAVASFGLAALLLVAPRPGVAWVAALGALTAAGTLAGLLLSTTVGLFGFTESTAAALWWESFWVESGAVVVLAALAVLTRPRRH